MKINGTKTIKPRISRSSPEILNKPDIIMANTRALITPETT